MIQFCRLSLSLFHVVSCIVFRFIFIHFDSTIVVACLNAQRFDFHGIGFCVHCAQGTRHKCMVYYSVIGNMRQSQCCPYFFTYYIYKFAAYISFSSALLRSYILSLVFFQKFNSSFTYCTSMHSHSAYDLCASNIKWMLWYILASDSVQCSL